MHNRNLTDNTYTLNHFYGMDYTHKPLYSNFPTETNIRYSQVSATNPTLNFRHSDIASFKSNHDLDNKLDKNMFISNNFSHINDKLHFPKPTAKDTYENKNQNLFTNPCTPINLKFTFNPKYLYKQEKNNLPLNEISNINTLSESTSKSNLEWKDLENKNKFEKINTNKIESNQNISSKNLQKEINQLLVSMPHFDTQLPQSHNDNDCMSKSTSNFTQKDLVKEIKIPNKYEIQNDSNVNNRDALNKRINFLQNEYTVLSNENNQLLKQNEQINKDKKTLEKNYNDLKNQYDQLENKHTLLNSLQANLELKLETLTNQYNNLQKQKLNLEQQYDFITNQQLSVDEDQSETIANLKFKLDSLENKYNDLQFQNETLIESNNEFKQQYNSMKKEKVLLKDQISSKGNEITNLINKNIKLNKMLLNKETIIADLATKNADLSKSTYEMEKNNNDLNNKINEYLNKQNVLNEMPNRRSAFCLSSNIDKSCALLYNR